MAGTRARNQHGRSRLKGYVTRIKRRFPRDRRAERRKTVLNGRSINANKLRSGSGNVKEWPAKLIKSSFAVLITVPFKGARVSTLMLPSRYHFSFISFLRCHSTEWKKSHFTGSLEQRAGKRGGEGAAENREIKGERGYGRIDEKCIERCLLGKRKR